MTNDREYMRSYMRRYRKRQALLDGKLKNSNRGRPRTIERVKRPELTKAVLDADGKAGDGSPRVCWSIRVGVVWSSVRRLIRLVAGAHGSASSAAKAS